MDSRPLSGVYAAALTPLHDDYSPDLDRFPEYLAFLAGRGCHGALLLGTTGEGPSFSPAEREALITAAIATRQAYPSMRLLAGTGTPSLTETIELTRTAFDLGVDAVVVLPPYYYRKASDDGLFAWFSRVMDTAVPEGGALLGYHIPQMSGMAFSLELLARLKDAYPRKFAGLKDSSGDEHFARQLGTRFGEDLVILTGNDRLFSLALEARASGCITAAANLFSPLLREIWDAHVQGQDRANAQTRLVQTRGILDRYQPAAASLKGLLAELYPFPLWPVRPPLVALPGTQARQFYAELQAAGLV